MYLVPSGKVASDNAFVTQKGLPVEAGAPVAFRAKPENKNGSATLLLDLANMEILLNRWRDLIYGMFPNSNFSSLFSDAS